jgi:CRP-like cAMP-binding protein
MDALINYLLQFGDLNEKQIEFIRNLAKEKEISKDEFYQEAGRTPKEFIFLVEGIFRISYYSNKGDEVTKYFLDENHFIIDLESYTLNRPSSEYFQAITDCRYVVLSRNAMKELSDTIVVWDEIMNRIISKALTEKVGKISMMMAEDATERYLNFFERFPKLANRIPLSYLASYLGITQSSLSRIRRSIS